MEQKHCTAYSSSRLPAREDDPQFNLQDWDSKARKISGQNTNSRRFSASNITALREDTCRSFRFNITISSTASSPGYPLKEEIDPSTYSFTTALKGRKTCWDMIQKVTAFTHCSKCAALQAKAARNNQDCLSPEGFALNSKWNDAEKYICNPLSGQVPIECLSARSFRNLQSRITVSAPLVYSAKTRVAQTKASLTARESPFPAPIGEKKGVGMTRDVGIQSAAAKMNDSSSSSSSSSSPCPASTPSIGERMSKRLGTEGGESPNSSSKQKSEEEDVEVNKGRGGGGEEERVEEEEDKEESCEGDQNINNGESDGIGSLWYDDDDHEKESRRSRQPAGGWCLSWMRSRKRDKLRSHKTKKPFFVPCTVAKRGGAIGNR